MKIWVKLYLLIMLLYLTVIGIVGIMSVESSYSSSLKVEIERTLEEHQKFHVSANVYIATYLESGTYSEKDTVDMFNPSSDKRIRLNDNIIKMFATKGNYIEIYDVNKKLIRTNDEIEWEIQRKELDEAIQGKLGYILRKKDGRHFIFSASKLNFDIIACTIRDITYVDSQRNEQYFFYIRIMFIGLLVLAIITPFFSKYITKPLEELTNSVRKIIDGNYRERITLKSKDEIGLLAGQFNTMAVEIEKRLNELTEEGERKQRFIENLVHELRTPLTSIIGYSDLLKTSKYEQESFYKYASNINSEGKRMLELSYKLMDMILLKKESAELAEENTINIFEDVANTMKLKLDKKKIKLETIAPENMSICIDKYLIRVFINNLVDNSIKASSEGKRITLEAGTREDGKYISVKDEGAGIPENELEKIIEPFYMLDKSRSRKEGGAGLGLSICLLISELHGARFNIQSQVGKGTKIELVFPKHG